MPNHPVTSRPMGAGGRREPRIGFIRPGQVEGAFIILLYAALIVLVLLSVLGTFYWWQGEYAPIGAPFLTAYAQIMWGVFGAPIAFVIAIAVQAVLTVIQYGARQLAKTDRRWWILYLVALGVSVYYNYEAYWTPLTALIPVYLAGILIVAGDVLPEFIAVRRE